MSNQHKPTVKQINLLKKFDIELPPKITKTATRNIISFILKGNGTIGKDINHRVNIFKKTQKKWEGKQIRRKRDPDACGTIINISAKSRGEIIEEIKTQEELIKLGWQEKKYIVSPFAANVNWDNEKPSRVSLGSLKIIE